MNFRLHYLFLIVMFYFGCNLHQKPKNLMSEITYTDSFTFVTYYYFPNRNLKEKFSMTKSLKMFGAYTEFENEKGYFSRWAWMDTICNKPNVIYYYKDNRPFKMAGSPFIEKRFIGEDSILWLITNPPNSNFEVRMSKNNNDSGYNVKSSYYSDELNFIKVSKKDFKLNNCSQLVYYFKDSTLNPINKISEIVELK